MTANPRPLSAPIEEDGGQRATPSFLAPSGLELYVDTRLGMGAYSQGSTVNPWPDQSGFARDLARDAANSQVVTFRVSDSLSALAPTCRFQKPGADTRAVYLFRSGIPNLNNNNGYTLITWIRSSSTPTVARSIWRHQTGARPEVFYNAGTAEVFLNMQGGTGIVGTGYILPQARTILAVRWVPPRAGAGACETWATVGTNPAPILQDTFSPWDWNSALANEFFLGNFESLTNFVNCFDLGLFALWSRNLSDAELSAAFQYTFNGFGL